jgi:V/A-type H+-transporting ATPase subunit C
MTGSAGRYAELAAAVRSYKADLTSRDQIERLIESGSLTETVGQLTHGQIALGDNGELASVEAFLIQRVISVAASLATYAPYDSRNLIRLVAQRYEFDCIKQLLKSTIEYVELGDALHHHLPAGRFTEERCKELIETHNPNRVIEAIQDGNLRQIVSSKLNEKHPESAVASIDQYYYGRLWAASNLPDPLDAQSARGLIGEFIDHVNVLLALRAKLVGMDASATSNMMIPVNYALGKAFTEITEASSFANAMRVMDKTQYSIAFRDLAVTDGINVNVERALRISHAQSCLNTFAGSPFNVGLALALLFLKDYELRDLLSVINGKANSVASDRITATLILGG